MAYRHTDNQFSLSQLTSTKIQLYLASASPRRHQLLTQLGYKFQVAVSNIPELKSDEESASRYVQRLANEKASFIFANLQANSVPKANLKYYVLGADTIVVCQGQVLEKPENETDANRMWDLLSNRTHQVMTAVSLVSSNHVETILSTTNVQFKKLTLEEKAWYWSTKEPIDKAGAYGIQGVGARFITHLSGSYHSVMGLPLYETAQLLEKNGLFPKLNANSPPKIQDES